MSVRTTKIKNKSNRIVHDVTSDMANVPCMKWAVLKIITKTKRNCHIWQAWLKIKSSNTGDLLQKETAWHWHPTSLDTDCIRGLKHWVRSEVFCTKALLLRTLLEFFFFFSHFLISYFSKGKKSKKPKELKQNRCSIKGKDLSENDENALHLAS